MIIHWREIPYQYREWHGPEPSLPDQSLWHRQPALYDVAMRAREFWRNERDRLAKVNPVWPLSARINPTWPTPTRAGGADG